MFVDKKLIKMVLLSVAGVGFTSNIYATTPADGRIVPSDTGFSQINANLGNVVEELCPQLVARTRAQQNADGSRERDLQQRCTEMVTATGMGVNEPALEEVLRQANAEEVATQGTGLVRLSAIQAATLATRLTQLQLAYSGSDARTNSVLALNQDTGSVKFGYSLGGSAGDSDFGRWSAYVNAGFANADKDVTANEAGFDLDRGSITLGADYRARDNLFYGANVAFTTIDANLDNDGSFDSDGTSVTLYATSFSNSGLYFQGALGYGQSDYDQSRRISYTLGSTTVNQTANSDTEGDQVFASIGVGKDYNKDDLAINVSALLDYLSADIDGFGESISDAGPGFGLGLEVDDQTIDSLRSTIGAQISKVIGTKSGVITPFLKAQWIHQFDDDPRTTRARFLEDPFSENFNQSSSNPAVFDGSTVFTLVTDEPDRNYFRLGLGLTSVLVNGLQLFAAFDTILGLDDIDQYSATAGLRKDW